MREKVDPPFDQLQGLVVRGRGRPDRELSSPGTSGADTVWGVDLSVVFLGTGGSVPTARRATACVLARVGGARILFDCGEGSQRQMQRSTGLVQVDEIYLTHYHADHYLGLPGLLKTYDLQARERPLRIVGPPGLQGLFSVLGRIFGKLSYDVELVELDEGEAVGHDGYRGPLVRGRPPDAGIRVRAGRGRAAGAVRSRRRLPSRRHAGPGLQPPSGGRVGPGLRRTGLARAGDGDRRARAGRS